MTFGGSRFYVRQDGLVGDLRDAVRPTVWHMGLSRGKPVTFSVEQNGGLWALVSKGEKGDVTPLADYETRDAAQLALKRLLRSLKRQGWGKRLLGAMGVVVLALLAYLIWTTMDGVQAGLRANQTQAPPTGQSLSADEVLRAPPPSAGTAR